MQEQRAVQGGTKWRRFMLLTKLGQLALFLSRLRFKLYDGCLEVYNSGFILF